MAEPTMAQRRPKLTVAQWLFLRLAERGTNAVMSYPPVRASLERGLISVRHSSFEFATFDLTDAGRQMLAEAREKEAGRG